MPIKLGSVITISLHWVGSQVDSFSKTVQSKNFSCRVVLRQAMFGCPYNTQWNSVIRPLPASMAVAAFHSWSKRVLKSLNGEKSLQIRFSLQPCFCEATSLPVGWYELHCQAVKISSVLFHVASCFSSFLWDFELLALPLLEGEALFIPCSTQVLAWSRCV